MANHLTFQERLVLYRVCGAMRQATALAPDRRFSASQRANFGFDSLCEDC
jgi:hypothetical protein